MLRLPANDTFMARFHTSALINQLQSDVHTLSAIVQQDFSALTAKQLCQQPTPEQWSIAQCLEHLNSYGLYYIPKIDEALQRGISANLPTQERFASSWLGNYFATSMKPGADGTVPLKMKAFKNHTPSAELDAQVVLQEFIKQQRQLNQLLELSKRTDMGKLRIPISIASWIKLSVGDTFRFLVAHEQRHIVQAQRVYRSLFHPEVIR
ncbi:DinB family protein [Spirosoma terrae]|uniref:DinB family protein n=1 Tax=Spirosoma terrae TaxID=1968276 RepID=A0A6L9LB69_9BACT|nr:DinB family protein [Spirosoma terrae]NDU96642.1 DinB family protein [Spirosoma terrae]